MNDKTNWTPGPWYEEGYDIKSPCCPIEIARVTVFNDGKCNAHLIAAAPELYDALNAMIEIVSDSCGVSGYHLNGETAEWDEFPEISGALDALAKARGEQ